jgi:DUF4097 and DUF4098 domain-containing protein YvlB
MREVKRTVHLASDGTVDIETFKGSITIESSDNPEVVILARIEPDPEDRHAKESVEKTEIDIDSSAREVRIKSDYDRIQKHRSWFSGLFDDDNVILPFVHYTISMPATARLSIKDFKSNVRINNLRSPIDVNTYKGTAVVSGQEGGVDLETYKGDVRVEMAKLGADSYFKTYKGKIRIDVPRDAAFELRTDFGRRVDFDSEFDAIYHSKRRSGDDVHGSVNGGGPVLHLSSEKGIIRLKSR